MDLIRAAGNRADGTNRSVQTDDLARPHAEGSKIRSQTRAGVHVDRILLPAPSGQRDDQ